MLPSGERRDTEDPVNWPRFTEDGGKAVPKTHYLIYNHYIRILLINANPLIYICYICGRGVEVGMVAIRDDELDVGDDEVASSDVAEGGKRVGKLWGVSRGWGNTWSLKTHYFDL
jgi:hypothetical protein